MNTDLAFWALLSGAISPQPSGAWVHYDGALVEGQPGQIRVQLEGGVLALEHDQTGEIVRLFWRDEQGVEAHVPGHAILRLWRNPGSETTPDGEAAP